MEFVNAKQQKSVVKKAVSEAEYESMHIVHAQSVFNMAFVYCSAMEEECSLPIHCISLRFWQFLHIF